MNAWIKVVLHCNFIFSVSINNFRSCHWPLKMPTILTFAIAASSTGVCCPRIRPPLKKSSWPRSLWSARRPIFWSRLSSMNLSVILHRWLRWVLIVIVDQNKFWNALLSLMQYYLLSIINFVYFSMHWFRIGKISIRRHNILLIVNYLQQVKWRLNETL